MGNNDTTLQTERYRRWRGNLLAWYPRLPINLIQNRPCYCTHG